MPHAPGHLRGAFVDWLEEGMPHEVAAEGPEHFFYDGRPRSRSLVARPALALLRRDGGSL
jgi:hypothetical protein